MGACVKLQPVHESFCVALVWTWHIATRLAAEHSKQRTDVIVLHLMAWTSGVGDIRRATRLTQSVVDWLRLKDWRILGQRSCTSPSEF
jgi:hypothetical protein